MSILGLSIVTLAALIVSGLISTVETAVTLISRARVEQMIKDDDTSRTRRLLQITERRSAYVNVLVLLRTLMDATAAIFAVLLAMEIWERNIAIAVSIVGVTLVSFAIIGVITRTVGRRNPYSVTLGSAILLKPLVAIFGPIARILIRIGSIFSPGKRLENGPYSGEVELREMVDIAQEKGVVEIEERRMIQSVFDLGSETARSVMVPRPEMVWIESAKSAGQATSLCVRSGFSRIPVIGESVDDIIGVVYLKDLVQRTYHSSDNGRSVQVADVMRPAVFVPDSRNLADLLEDMQRDRNHIAILIDEYGAVAGLISIEDILEEIVGEIADEYDKAEVAPITELAEHELPTYRVVSRLTLEDLKEQLEEDLDFELELTPEAEEQVETVGGLIAYEIGRVPLPGTEIECAGLRLVAEGGRDRRGRISMKSVVVTVLPKPEPAGEEAEEE
ncbi:MAG: hemolysin family protein [Corynebacterium sp.]|nr:hemolysin family protein [Corynebacterium sp.]